MSAVEDYDLAEFEEGEQLTLSNEQERRLRLETPEQRRRRLSREGSARARAKKKKFGKPTHRKMHVPTVGAAVPFVIVPEIAPHLRRLAEIAGVEAGVERGIEGQVYGSGILGARVAPILGITPEGVVRRLHAVINKKQLFINANFVEACLMAMDAEHEIRYGEWPSSKAAALERVSIAAEMKGKKLSPDKLLAQAERLYYKGMKKAYKRVAEVSP